MSKLLDPLAAMFRVLPRFRGKSHLGIRIGGFLINKASDSDCIRTIKMRDGSLMQVDVRSMTERRTYWTGEYDPQVLSRLVTCLREDWVVFDVGANVGFYSIALGSKLQALQGNLHAFEPVKSNFDRLVHCITLNKLGNVVVAHNLALGDEEGTIELHMDNRNNACTGNAVILRDKVLTEDKLECNATAPIIKLDTFAREHQIPRCDLIKVDVEGAEVMFLRGGTDFLSSHRPIIYGEFNSYWLKQFGHSFLDVANIVKPWGYRFFKQMGRTHFIEFIEPVDGVENVLLCPSDTPGTVLAHLGVSGI